MLSLAVWMFRFLPEELDEKVAKLHPPSRPPFLRSTSFFFSAGHFNVSTLMDNMKKLNNTFAGNTRHFDNEIDLDGSEGLDGMKVDNNSEDVPSVCRSCMPECQRCHSRLNASVQGLEKNFRRYRYSPPTHDAFPAQYKPLLFSSTNDQYPISQAPQL